MRINKFQTSVAIYTFTNFSVSAFPFLLLPFLTRWLSPEEYGTVAIYMIVVSFLATLIGLNLHGAIMVRYFDRTMFNISTYTSTVLSIIGAIFLCSMLVVIVFRGSISSITELPLNWILAAVFTAVCQSVAMILLGLWQASQQPYKYAAFRLGHAMMDGMLSVLLVGVFALNVDGRLLGITSAWVISALLALWFIFRGGWLVQSIKKADAIDALRYGVPLLPHAIGWIVLAMADRFFITNLLDIAETGQYVVAAQLGLILSIAADAFNKAFAPWLMEALKNKNRNKEIQIVKYTYLYFGLILSLAFLGGCYAEIIISVVAGSRYQAAAEVLGYILIGNAFTGMYYMTTNYIFYVRRTELLSLMTISIGSIIVLLSWFFISEYGIVGAGIAFMVGQILMFMGTWYFASKCHPMPWDLGFSRS
jgi:O-antigen/teichoic acid export membrane protein